MNPDILKSNEKYLLKSAEPGALTHILHGFTLLLVPAYFLPVYRNFGMKGFLRPKVTAPLFGLIGLNIVLQPIANRFRESLWSGSRERLVENYKEKWGEEYLLDVLNPTFRLPEEA